jgi:hypothetical protein
MITQAATPILQLSAEPTPPFSKSPERFDQIIRFVDSGKAVCEAESEMEFERRTR